MNLTESQATLASVRLAGRKDGMKAKFRLAITCVPTEPAYVEVSRLLPEVEAARKATLRIPVEHQGQEEDDAEDLSRPKGGASLKVEAERLGNMTHTLRLYDLPPDRRTETCAPLVEGVCSLDRSAEVLIAGEYPRFLFGAVMDCALLPGVAFASAADWVGKTCYVTLVQTQAELEPGEATKPKKRKKAAQLVLADAVVMTPAKVAEMREVEAKAVPPSAGPEDAPPAEPQRPEAPSMEDARASWADRKGAALLNKGKVKLDAVIKAADERGGVYGYLDDAETLALVWLRPGSVKDLVRAPIERCWCVVGRNEDGWIAVPVVQGKAAAINPELAPAPTASSEWMAAVSASDEAGAPEVEFATLSEADLKALDRQALEGGRTKLDEFLAPLTLEQLRAQHFASGAGPCRATSADFVRHAIANHCRGRGIR